MRKSKKALKKALINKTGYYIVNDEGNFYLVTTHIGLLSKVLMFSIGILSILLITISEDTYGTTFHYPKWQIVLGLIAFTVMIMVILRVALKLTKDNYHTVRYMSLNRKKKYFGSTNIYVLDAAYCKYFFYFCSTFIYNTIFDKWECFLSYSSNDEFDSNFNRNHHANAEL